MALNCSGSLQSNNEVICFQYSFYQVRRKWTELNFAQKLIFSIFQTFQLARMIGVPECWYVLRK